MGKLSFRKFKPQTVTQLVSEEGMRGRKPRSNEECALNLSCSYLSPALCCPVLGHMPLAAFPLSQLLLLPEEYSPADIPLTCQVECKPRLPADRREHRTAGIIGITSPSVSHTAWHFALCQAHSKYSNAGGMKLTL